MENFKFLVDGILALLDNGGWKYVVMWLIGALLIFLAIKKEMEPTLLLPMGLGAILETTAPSGRSLAGNSASSSAGVFVTFGKRSSASLL